MYMYVYVYSGGLLKHTKFRPTYVHVHVPNGVYLAINTVLNTNYSTDQMQGIRLW